MPEAKPFASLSPGLLARKGGARPAMRHQLQPKRPFADNTARRIDEDDLGWNDHGDDAPVQHAAIVPLTKSASAKPRVPEVVRQRMTIADRLNSAKAGSRRSALADGRRAAFTLRLDEERHLRLRLACTIEHRSAQQIVTEALDRLLAEAPEINALADQVRRRK